MASTSNPDTKSVSTEDENRTRLCEEFAAVAGTDSAVAQCYLAENEWEMEVLYLHQLRTPSRNITYLKYS